MHLHGNFSLLPASPRCLSHWGLLSSQTPWKDLSSNHFSLYRVRNFMPTSSSGDMLCSSMHKYLLTSIPSHSFFLSASHTMRNSEESFPIHTFSALMFTRSFFTYYIICFSPGQKKPLVIYLFFILKKRITD